MKKLLACLFLLNLSVFSSGFGMKGENLEVPECDFQETCLDENSRKWEEKLNKTLKNKQKYYEEHKVPAAVIECIFTIGYNEMCKKALVKMFKHFEGEFQRGKWVLAGDLLNYEVKHIEPCFLSQLIVELKNDNLFSFKELILRRFEAVGAHVKIPLTPDGVFQLGADFIASYIEVIYRNLPEKNTKELEIEMVESSGFKMSETLKAFFRRIHQGTLSYEQSRDVIQEMEKIKESKICLVEELKMSVYRSCDQTFLMRHFGPFALIKMGLVAVIGVVPVSSRVEKKDVR